MGDSAGYVRCVRGTALKSGVFSTSTINGDVIVTDSTSGLIWQKTSSSATTWSLALSYCENLTYATYSDWRLPNKNELLSLVNFVKSSAPYSNFPDIPSNEIWSSTTNENKSQVFAANYGYYAALGAVVGVADYLSKTHLLNSYTVICIRSE